MDVEFVVELEEGGEADRSAGRDGRRDHQHRLAARVRQRPRQRPQDGHKRHGRLARQGLRDGALGRAPADRLPGALRRRHRRRVDGPRPPEEPAAEEGRSAPPPSPRRREVVRHPGLDRVEDERASQDRRVLPALLGRVAGKTLDGGLAVRRGIPVSGCAGERAGVEPGRARPRAARRFAGGRCSGGSGRRSCWSSRTTDTGRSPNGRRSVGRSTSRSRNRCTGGSRSRRRRRGRCSSTRPPSSSATHTAWPSASSRRSRGPTGSTTAAAPWRPGGRRGSRRTRRSRHR